MKDSITHLETELGRQGIINLGCVRIQRKWVATATHKMRPVCGRGESLLEALEDLIKRHATKELEALLAGGD